MDSKLLLFVFLILNRDKDSNKMENTNNIDLIKSLGGFLKTLEIESEYTKEKIRILKKVGHYFPEEYIGLLNRSILYTERIVKFNEFAQFMKYENYEYVATAAKFDNNKDRVSKILDTIQKEAPEKYDVNLGIFMDLIINTDKYKKMFNLLTSVTKDPNAMKEPAKLIETLAPILGGDDEKNKDKIKEMSKMVEIMSLLNEPKKE